MWNALQFVGQSSATGHVTLAQSAGLQTLLSVLGQPGTPSLRVTQSSAHSGGHIVAIMGHASPGLSGGGTIGVTASLVELMS